MSLQLMSELMTHRASQQYQDHHQQVNSVVANITNRQWDEKESKNHSTTAIEAWEEQKDEGNETPLLSPHPSCYDIRSSCNMTTRRQDTIHQ